MIKPNDFERARILIVDDSPDSARLLTELLALNNYHNVHSTVDAAVVCDLHDVNAYDLILLDMHMPYISGLKVMEQMRKLTPGLSLPVIVLTGDDNLRLPALETGAYDFITKPFDVMELTVRIHNMLEVRLLHRFIDEQHRLQQNTAVYDPVTGLPNRRLAMDRIGAAIERGRRRLTMTAVICLEVEGFNMVKDQYGDEYGDTLLKNVAAQLSDQMREEDTVARIGAEEFLIVVSDIGDVADVVWPARRILHQFSTATLLQDAALELTSSLGIALCPFDAEEPADLVLHADQALHAAHRAGKNQYRFATADRRAAG